MYTYMPAAGFRGWYYPQRALWEATIHNLYAVHWVRGNICTKQDVPGKPSQKSDVVGIFDSGNSIGISIGR
eukprot:SAG11_NODE_933_length_6488_cov_18.190014_5_plen_71_part_00